ncbi:DUF1501 domain-containing protein [Kamptonema cortianum]|nr:DUF1501 domain-containing protein [Geitlerinema splendidum]MDK3156314.1 DUF1501 domain-containing protein [Kamptonema cortianum]
MEFNRSNACDEYKQLSRRTVLTGSAMTAAAMILPAWMPKMAFAQSGSGRDVLISIFLRGGADSLTLCCPHGDPIYYSERPTIAVPQPGSGSAGKAIDLNGYFGIPGSMGALMEAYNNGHLAIVQAVGRDNWSRSHFDAQARMETESLRNGQGGWLARHLATVAPSKADAGVRGFAFTGMMPQILSQAPQTVSTPDPDGFSFDGRLGISAEIYASLRRQYSRVRDDTRAAFRDGLRAAESLASVDFGGYQPSPGAVYSNTEFGQSLKATAAMIRADVGLEVAHIDVHGWDTHANQGSLGGALESLMVDLASNMMAIYRDLGGAGFTRYTVLVQSEFGRQVFENGCYGTDHGTGGIMYALGPNVNGGRVVADWPGLQVENRFEGVDLRPTIDSRLVIAELLQKRLKNANIGQVLPGYFPGATKNIFKAA